MIANVNIMHAGNGSYKTLSPSPSGFPHCGHFVKFQSSLCLYITLHIVTLCLTICLLIE